MKKSGVKKPSISDAAVLARTGKTWREWYRVLDAAGAKTMTHREIVACLAGEHDVGPWWRQMVAVTYEQVRRGRPKHEKPDGYEISVSRTIGSSAEKLFEAWTDARIRSRWLKPAPLTIKSTHPAKSFRALWAKGASRLEVRFAPGARGKTQVTAQHRKLANAREASRMKKFWGEALDRLREMQTKKYK